MVIIFQRFTPYLWGISQQDTSKVEVKGRLFHITEGPSRFQLHGRRTTSFDAELVVPQQPKAEADPVQITGGNGAEQNMDNGQHGETILKLKVRQLGMFNLKLFVEPFLPISKGY